MPRINPKTEPDPRIEFFLEPIKPDSPAANQVLADRIGDPDENALKDVRDQDGNRHNVWRCKTREIMIEIWGGKRSTRVKFAAWKRFGSWGKLSRIPDALLDHWAGNMPPKAESVLVAPETAPQPQP